MSTVPRLKPLPPPPRLLIYNLHNLFLCRCRCRSSLCLFQVLPNRIHKVLKLRDLLGNHLRRLATARLFPEEIVVLDAPDFFLVDAAETDLPHLSAFANFEFDVFAHRGHGSITARLGEVTAGHALGFSHELVEIELLAHRGVFKDDVENAFALSGVGEFDVELLGHAAQDGLVDVLDAVGGAKDHDLSRLAGGAGAHEAVPVRHELGLHHGASLVVRAAARPKNRVDFVDEDNGGLELARERENGGHEFIRVAIPLLRESADVEVDEAGAGLFGECARKHGFTASRRSVEKHTLGGGEERRGVGKEGGESERVDDGFAEFVDDGFQAADGWETLSVKGRNGAGLI